jgi:hypothetical protein
MLHRWSAMWIVGLGDGVGAGVGIYEPA